MDSMPQLTNVSEMISPSLVIVTEALDRNLQQMIAIAGSTARLRPHCKTHKMAAVTQRELALGITKHKCATFAEAEMLADAGVKDIFLAYNLVGPNIDRAVKFRSKYPGVAFAVTADDAAMIDALSAALQEPRGWDPATKLGAVLDIDTGLHRTGVSDPAQAAALYDRLRNSPGLEAWGFHVYDGHNHQTPFEERTAAVLAGWEQARKLRDDFVARGWSVPRIICGGTGSFPVFAKLTDPAIELSPGTCVLHDTGYAAAFPEMQFEPAEWILTRVISRPTDDRLTCDLGNKAVASDPPKGQRVFFPALPDAEQVLHNEEHLVLKTPLAKHYKPGDVLFAIPRHVCPTSALHKWVYVAEGGRMTGQWTVTSRDRQITI